MLGAKCRNSVRYVTDGIDFIYFDKSKCGAFGGAIRPYTDSVVQSCPFREVVN